MNWSWHTVVAFSVLAAGTMLPGEAVAQQSTSATQVLDRVNAVSPKAVLDMAFDDPAAAVPFETPPEITTTRGFTSCQLTAERGLFCLDQNTAGAPGRFHGARRVSFDDQREDRSQCAARARSGATGVEPRLRGAAQLN